MISRVKSSSLILSIFVVLLFLFSAPSAFAQTGTDCKLTPSAPSCLSFDPSVNPILIAQKLVYPTNPGGQNLQNIPEKGVCQEYRDSSFSLSQGCLNKGVFKWTSEDVSPEGNLTTTTADSTGNVTSDTGTAVGNAAATVTGGDCTAWNPLTYGSCALKGIAGVILGFANVLLGIAGVLFNLVIVKTVFEFANVIGNSPGLLLAWGILRDIGNMALLFGFIFMGIATILDLHNYNAKKTLPFLIIFAILMNFSLFAAEVVIDTSNVFSSVLYNQANSSPCDTVSTNEPDDARKCLINNGLAGQVLQATGLSTIWKTDRPDIAISTYLLLALFVTITAVVLFAGAIMLIIRAVTLTFLMVTAPIGFAGMAIPMLHGAAKQWWSALIAQSFFAPVFILCILISLKITEGLSGGGGTSSFVDALSNNDTVFLEVLVIFALVIGFMVMSLYVAKKMGAMGAGFAVNKAGGAVYGAMGALGRRTVGRASVRVAERIRRSDFGYTRTGKLVAGGFDFGAKSSFDFRGTTASGMISAQTGEMGKAQKGGYTATLHEEEESRVKYANSLKQSPEMKKEEEALNKRKKEEAEKREIQIKKTEADATAGVNDLKNNQKPAAALRESERSIQNERLQKALAFGEQNQEQIDKEVANATKLAEEHAVAQRQELEDLTALEAGFTARKEAEENAYKGIVDDLKKKLEGDEEKGTVGVDSKAPKRTYANALQNQNGLFGAMRITTGTSDSDHHAYQRIRADLNKTSGELQLDSINKTLKNLRVNDNDNGDANHAPTAPVGGGPQKASTAPAH